MPKHDKPENTRHAKLGELLHHLAGLAPATNLLDAWIMYGNNQVSMTQLKIREAHGTTGRNWIVLEGGGFRVLFFADRQELKNGRG